MNVRNNTCQNCYKLLLIEIVCGLRQALNIMDKYNNVMNRFLGDIDLDCELFTCSNCNYSLDTHKLGIVSIM